MKMNRIAVLAGAAIVILVLAGVALGQSAEGEGEGSPPVGAELIASLGLEIRSGMGGANPCAGAPMVEHPLPDSTPGDYVCLPPGTTIAEAGSLMVRFYGRQPSDLELEFFSLQEELALLQDGAETGDPADQARQAQVIDRIAELRAMCARLDTPAWFCGG